MQLSRKALNARWAWTSAAAIAALVVLNFADTMLKSRTGYGTVDMQGVGTGWGIRVIADHWASPPDATLAGFGLGFDYLFMPLYGAALYFGSIVARERFAPKPGIRRRIMALLAMAPVVAALFDACENTLEIMMLTGTPTDALAGLALQATAAKYVGVLIGLLLSLTALVGLLLSALKKRTAADEDSKPV
jgi:hypothetical protein